ncbi:MAG: hypothetical protein HFG02_00280 [Oscillibacter sp.]|nr:hypothetical protein [Oscillibacter sp.]
MSGNFLAIAREHWTRYPRMEPQDFAKLAYQSEFGPAHMVQSPDKVLSSLLMERKEAGTQPMPPEPIGNGLCRFPITQALSTLWELPLIGRMFTRTMAEAAGSREGLTEKLEHLSALPVPGLNLYLESWRREGCPPVHHSEAYRNAYRPHYRVLQTKLAGFLPALVPLEKLERDVKARRAKPAAAAVDGRCGSGKTGFASLAAELIPCRVLHMDDYYLPWEHRVSNWMEIPAGNMDLERFRKEVLLPALKPAQKRETAELYHNGVLLERRELEIREGLILVEGTYSQHPDLAGYYDYKLFLSCEKEEQTRRLQAREGDYYPTFDQVWRTLEERYFAACGTEKAADLVVDTTGFFT